MLQRRPSRANAPTAHAEPEAVASTTKKRKGFVANALELVLTIAIAIGLALLVQAFLVKPYRIPSGSMIPTLAIGQRILVNRLDTHPAIGEIVVFHPPTGATGGGICGDSAEGVSSNGTDHLRPCDKNLPSESSQTFVKRVVGVPGDHLRIADGIVSRLIHGRWVKEKFAYNVKKATADFPGVFDECSPGGYGCTFKDSFTVPAGEYYMMGDNRGDSLDSRYWGPVPQKWIIGVAFATYWPINRIGFF